MLSIRTKSRAYIIAAVAIAFINGAPVGGSETFSSGVQVELDSQKPLSVRVTVSSRAERRVTFPKYRLPWGNGNSIIFVPVNSDGQCIGSGLVPIDDSGYEKVSLDPNESITGEIDLRGFVPELERGLKKSDVHLFWAYKPPEELHIGSWAGGWILIPRQK